MPIFILSEISPVCTWSQTPAENKTEWGHENGHENQHNNKLKIAFLSFYLLSSPVIVNRR